MEIDTRFPTIQAGQPFEARDGDTQAPPPAVLAGSGSRSEFFISPVLRFDSRSLTVIFQVRDSRSGDVVRQFPPETVVERYRQDPSAKPFTLSPGTASGQDEAEASDADSLAPFPEPDDGRNPTATTGTPQPGGRPAGEPVDLVA